MMDPSNSFILYKSGGKNMLCIFYHRRGNECVACELWVVGSASLVCSISMTDYIMNQQ